MMIFLFFVCAIGILVFILPYFLILATPFTQPSGKWQVGTSDLIWDKTGLTGIIAKLWYPTDTANNISSPYIDNIDLTLLAITASLNPLYRLIFNRLYLGRIQTPSCHDTVLGNTQNGFPIVLFSPGFGGINLINTFYALEFASHGFIVVGINHPGSSGITLLNNGAYIGVDRSYDRLLKESPKLLRDNPADFDRLTDEVRIQSAENISILLDRVLCLNATVDSQLYRKIDENRIFAAGHSSGGAASFIACGRDRRISKALNLDGGIIDPDIDSTNYDCKELFLINADRQKYPDKNNRAEFDALFAKDELRVEKLAAKANLQQIQLKLAHHLNFTDLPLFIMPAFGRVIGFMGDVDGRKMLAKTSAIAIEFFNEEPATPRNS
jgi:Platelet-activating factor acetylhydrolase, isoform II